ncbi:MAG: AMP-binding protein [Clostridia bacterium]|nr:AMP-binding protein [Clostridia bacterium]
MKLSFSTKGWHNKSFDEFCDIAVNMNFKGIELHNIYNPIFTEKDGAFYNHAANVTLRKLYEKKLNLPCIDTICNPCDVNKREEAIAEITKCIDIAKNLHIPNVRIRAISDNTVEVVSDILSDVIKEILPIAESRGITILVETRGVYCNTAALRDLLERFASDNLAALWDMYSTYFVGNESADTTIKNLGAYVKHVHIKDAVKSNDNIEFVLMGEGELPVDQMMNALRSVNYDEFVSLEWDPKWCEELDDIEIIFSQFVNYMRQFGDVSKSESALYYNRAHTGKYVWEKDRLIDATFSDVLDRMVEEFPDQYAFKYTTLDYTRTYSEFRDDVDNFARTLISLGVKPGSHVAVWASNVPQWYIAFWSTVKIGAVLVTVNTAYKIHEIEYLLKQSDTHTLIMTEGGKDCNYGEVISTLCPELETLTPGAPLHAKRLPFLRNVITVGYKLKGCLTWPQALERSSQVPVSEVYRLAASVDKNDVCNMQYTSGTTGFPKGVMLTHYNVVNNGKYIGDHMELSTADRMMIQVPMFHCFGMVLSMTASMTHGATMCPLPYFSPKSALACINSERITAFNGVPTMFIAMMQHPDFDTTDFSHIRVGIMAGANCPADLMKKATEVMNMKEIVSVYGQTEASPGCTMSSYYDSLTVRTETVGSAFANVECKIVDPETGLECPNGTNGEFVARGYNIMKGYYKMPTATAEAIDKDGWLHTGDLACKDDDGNYRITGRLKDMIIRGGENIYPKEIEEFIYTCDKVSDVQVIGVPDKQYGEEIMACIILKEGQTMTEQEMKDYIAAHMARHKVPRYIEFVSSFPMNAAGKILKYKMREDAAKKLGLN